MLNNAIKEWYNNKQNEFLDEEIMSIMRIAKHSYAFLRFDKTLQFWCSNLVGAFYLYQKYLKKLDSLEKESPEYIKIQRKISLKKDLISRYSGVVANLIESGI